ncbi:hypothetical protein VNO77_24615 [Canavalia gladiata]|uniref:Uncharacterized protein n=1 Tax=Canavalia gladiata TaxID=3824 RepID=A0AAN9L7D4_CANGL
MNYKYSITLAATTLQRRLSHALSLFITVFLSPYCAKDFTPSLSIHTKSCLTNHHKCLEIIAFNFVGFRAGSQLEIELKHTELLTHADNDINGFGSILTLP